MNIGEKIYQLRKQKGLSQEELAEQLGVTRQAVSKWELGTSVPELESVVALAKLFGVSTDHLLTDTVQNRSAHEEAPKQGWLDRLPGFLGKLLRRFGWLAGVYMAVVGGLFMGIGAMVRFMVQQMFSMGNSSSSAFGGMGYSDPLFDAYNQQVSAMAQNNPVSVVANVVMILGAVMIVAGIILAVILKRKSKIEQ